MVTLKNTGLFWRQHKTQNTTHTDTTANKMSHAILPSSSFAPSLSMGRAVAPPNHGAAAPQCHAQAASCQGCTCCHWFARLGRQNKRHQIIERGGGALALGGRRCININNNQMEDGVDVRGCIGEEARPGQNAWGGWLPVVWGEILIDKKNREMGGPFALDGRRLMGGHNNQPKLASTVGGALKRRGDRGRMCGGVLSLCLERQIDEEKSNNENMLWP
jgi:hypothetical protein